MHALDIVIAAEASRVQYTGTLGMTRSAIVTIATASGSTSVGSRWAADPAGHARARLQAPGRHRAHAMPRRPTRQRKTGRPEPCPEQERPVCPGSDPAGVLETAGSQALRATLQAQAPLSHSLMHERLDNLAGIEAVREAVRVIAAADPSEWDDATTQIALTTGVPTNMVRRELARAAEQWDRDPRVRVAEAIGDLRRVRERITSETSRPGITSTAPPHLPAPTNPVRSASPRR